MAGSYAHREKIEVSNAMIRQRFREGQFLELVNQGILQQEVGDYNYHFPTPPLNLPFCTRSQIVRYLTREGAQVALVHQYLKPDGNLGASGLPDPKWLVVGETILYTRNSR